ncbi:MAG: sulfocyanin-like copper-binding protein [Firmicutes bacterium]|nr:sulfocyanin-like copper-binding protein [Bacillota bacterium]
MRTASMTTVKTTGLLAGALLALTLNGGPAWAAQSSTVPVAGHPFTKVVAHSRIAGGRAATLLYGDLRVQIPKGAFTGLVSIELVTAPLTVVSRDAPHGKRAVADFALRVTDLETGKLITRANKPVLFTDSAYAARVASLDLSGGWVVIVPSLVTQSGTSGLVTANPWLAYNLHSKTVDLKMFAGQTGNNGGFNFDGYSMGKLNITIPVGWTVHVTFRNDSSDFPHSLILVPFKDRMHDAFTGAAFAGAETASTGSGLYQGTVSEFAFKASSSGHYAFVCGVPGHAADGMWDSVTISDAAPTPSFSV